MKTFKVLGSGCAKCKKTAKLIEEEARAAGTGIRLIKETSPEAIMGYGVMSTPAVVCDEKVIHSGGVPDREQVREWVK